ncbi:Coenzyme F420-reducing hydrogenase, beta subunit [Tangfeifania diversioriginum]|uniref:Coenzyme F420-reducing hydrogenase, beta subunit n=1 Tax=Tangfeifania diversioriginum TaxID=1168035 RepID=A0A1M6NNN5_9BACT|nr:Coenzyme F420 hydrogenase/dehydrogenase, beta subunit C-terminal domain [Tangfeifania diversioriginum]SHJ97367.1 Coenzyme F420-reducing hydrogenase, beta subunit [Tangfeifania diversioriginum]
MAVRIQSDLDQLELIKKNYCIGCGVCTTTKHTSLYLDEIGKYKLKLKNIDSTNVNEVLEICPFSSKANNEDKLGELLFSTENIRKNDNLGFYLSNYIGHIKEDSIRLKASSGGIITWLLKNLLNTGYITHAVHVGNSKSRPLLFEYSISEEEEAILTGASSRYYPVELSKVLNYIKNNDGRYAIVALPCFAKGIRLLQQRNSLYKERIKYVISPVCGHLKTANYARFLAWQKGIFPNELNSINFRKKIPDRLASQYGTEFFSIKNNQNLVTTVNNSTYKMGTDWGHGMFKNPACDFCDDTFGEVADISVGDAWLPQYIKDYKGNSVIVVRNPEIDEILKADTKNGELYLDKVEPEMVEKSQAGGIRNKRGDLKYRLWLKEQKGNWYPPKRIGAFDNDINDKRKKIVRLRIQISQVSHQLFIESLNKGNLKYFYKKMMPLLNHYFITYYGPIKFIKHKLKQLL